MARKKLSKKSPQKKDSVVATASDLILRYVRLRNTLDPSKPRRQNRPPLPAVLDPLTGLVPTLTTRQVASRLNKSIRSVYRLVEQRKLACFKTDGDLRFESTEVERYLQKRLRRGA